MFQNFLLKTMLKRQMKNVSAEQQEQIFAMIEKNPDFFMKIAEEAQEKIKGGMSQQDAMMAVMKVHESELRAVMGK
jgi:predicted DNA-binding protein